MERMKRSEPHDREAPDPRRAGLLGLLLILLLVCGGVYLAHVLRGASQLQDCVMSGRTNCAPIETSAAKADAGRARTSDPAVPAVNAAGGPAADAAANVPAGADPAQPADDPGHDREDCGRHCERGRERPEY